MAFAIRSIPTVTVDGNGIIIRVYAPTGAIIAVSKDDDVYSGTEESGVWDFIVPEYGTYLVTARSSGSEVTRSVEVTPTEVDLVFNNTFGVCWDYSNPSTALERLQPDTDPYGYVNARITEEPAAAVGTGIGRSPFDAYYPWAGMEQYNILPDDTIIKRGEEGFSQTEHDTMVWIPEFYYKVIDVPEQSKRYWYICRSQRDGFDVHPGSNKYVGRYVNNKDIKSASNGSIYTAVIGTTNNSITNKGKNWYLINFPTLCAIRLLYLIEYANWDSQSKIGLGIVNEIGNRNSGESDIMIYHTGTVKNDGISAMQYRWIENLYGQSDGQFMSGIIISSRRVYLSYNPIVVSTVSNYINTNFSYATDLNGVFPISLHYFSEHPWVFLGEKSGGSESTYIPDTTQIINGRVNCNGGGSYASGAKTGMFAFGQSVTNAAFGSRSMYIPKE